jgi:ABC-2 type transport system ATP-binding protein
MEDRSAGYIGNLSKGMRQRIGLAQALIHEPEVLILDEPTIGLDPAQIHEVRNLIREIGKERTVLLSTHILSEAQQVCNRVLIINKGKIVVEDTPDEIQSRLEGGRRISVRVAGEVKDLEILINGIPGVSRVVDVFYNGLDFETTPGQDVRPEVARKIVSSGFDLLELKPLGLSLEEIFLELTKEQTPQLEDDEAGEEDISETDEEEKEG